MFAIRIYLYSIHIQFKFTHFFNIHFNLLGVITRYEFV